MIIVLFNEPNFEYDVHSLVKAFFPKEEVAMYYTCPEEVVGDRNVACTHRDIEELLQDELQGLRGLLRVDYKENGITLFYASILQELSGETARALVRQWSASGESRVIDSAETVDVSVEAADGTWKHQTRSFAADHSDRTATKDILKHEIYDMLANVTGQELPWGTLTGIRPTKIPMKLLEEGKTRDEIASYMKDEYLASDEKIQLSIDIAERERKVLSQIDHENGYSLYIGIPFCPSTCLYCSFTSYPLGVWSKRVNEYLDALEKELDYTAAKFYHKKLNSIYIGGGTPTTLEPSQLDRLIRKIKCSFDLSNCVEFTVEAGRPDSITREKLEVLRKHGITRISINPQTMKQETLDIIGRHHTVAQTLESFRLARELGFDNINMDLILGLPDETIEDVRHTMEVITELRPENVTIHSLAIKRAARLNIFKDRYEQMQMVNTQEHMDLCAEYLKNIGLTPYYLYRQKGMAGNMENVGYALEEDGKAGAYNILIMEEKQTIVALGAGASTKRVYPDGRIERVENVKDVSQYIERIDEMIERKNELFLRE